MRKCPARFRTRRADCESRIPCLATAETKVCVVVLLLTKCRLAPPDEQSRIQYIGQVCVSLRVRISNSRAIPYSPEQQAFTSKSRRKCCCRGHAHSIGTLVPSLECVYLDVAMEDNLLPLAGLDLDSRRANGQREGWSVTGGTPRYEIYRTADGAISPTRRGTLGR